MEGSLEEVNAYLVKATDAGADADRQAREDQPAGDADTDDDGGPGGTAPPEALPQGFRPATGSQDEGVKQPVGHEEKR